MTPLQALPLASSLLLLGMSVSAAGVPEDEMGGVSTAIVALVDGSILHGTILHETTSQGAWKIDGVLGELTVPLSLLGRLDRVGNEGRVFTAALSSGDRVTGTIRDPALDLATIIGTLDVAFEHVTSIEITATTLPVPRTGPILHHDFRGYTPNDFAGKIADLSGHDRTGRFVGSDLRSPGLLEHSFFEHRFDSGSPLFPTDTPFTVVVTFRTSCTEPLEMMLWSTHYAGSGTDGGWLQVDTETHGGRLRFFLGPQHTEITGETVVNDGRWHTAVARWDGRAIQLYLDGECEGTAVTSTPIIYTQRAPLRYGHTASNGAVHRADGSPKKESYYFRGEIGEAWIYDRTLYLDECGPRAENAAGESSGTE